jgi:hypothetical protein
LLGKHALNAVNTFSYHIRLKPEIAHKLPMSKTRLLTQKLELIFPRRNCFNVGKDNTTSITSRSVDDGDGDGEEEKG